MLHLLTFVNICKHLITFVNNLTCLPHLAPSWILSLAENLASLSLQDGARIGTIIIEPASQQPTLILCGVPPSVFEFCAVSPPQCDYLNTFFCSKEVLQEYPNGAVSFVYAPISTFYFRELF